MVLCCRDTSIEQPYQPWRESLMAVKVGVTGKSDTVLIRKEWVMT